MLSILNAIAKRILHPSPCWCGQAVHTNKDWGGVCALLLHLIWLPTLGGEAGHDLRLANLAAASPHPSADLARSDLARSADITATFVTAGCKWKQALWTVLSSARLPLQQARGFTCSRSRDLNPAPDGGC